MSESFIGTRDGSATSFVGEAATKLFAMIVVRNAIELYLKTGMRANRAYTPTAMAQAAGRYTGKGPFAFSRGRRGLAQAVTALDAAIDAARAVIEVREV